MFRSPLRLLALATFAILAATPLSAAPPTRPNILVLFADDQSFETIRALGHTDIDTPHLDRLVQRGTVFTHAFNMGSFSPAVCVASRTMLMTGRSLWLAKGIYGAYLDHQRAVIHDGWKLILYPKAHVARLYHVAADPDERRDLAADPTAHRRDLFQRLRLLQRELADPLDLASVFPGL